MTVPPPRPEESKDGSRLPFGYVIRDRYEIRRFISLGATTRVYAAEDRTSGRMVAVKVVRVDVGMQRGVIDRFQHEVLVCRLFDSPHLPRVYDQGRLDNGSLFMVMELLSGQTLDQRLGRGALAVATVVELGRQLCRGLSAAHAKGIVHCDVKPHNVILQPSSELGILVKLIDFGIATRDAGRVDTGLRRDTVLGTPAYMSPEQIRGMRVDVRTDLYSAGVVLYQTLTDRLPFDGNSSRSMMEAALRDPVIAPHVLRPSCPDSLERVLLRAMHRDRDERYQSADEFGRELEQVALLEKLPQGPTAWLIASEAQSRSVPAPYEPTKPVRRVEPARARSDEPDTEPLRTLPRSEEFRAWSETGEAAHKI